MPVTTARSETLPKQRVVNQPTIPRQRIQIPGENTVTPFQRITPTTTPPMRPRTPNLPPAPPNFRTGRVPSPAPVPDIALEVSEGFAEAFGYYLGGVWRGLEGKNFRFKEDTQFPEQDLPISEGAQHGLKLRENIKNTLKKVPSFEIPKLRIPELKLPQIPKIELPKLPELPKVPELPKLPGLPKIPQINTPKLPSPQLPKLPSPKPTPTPKPRTRTPKPGGLIEQLEDEDMSMCGGFYIAGVNVLKITIQRYYVFENGFWVEKTKQIPEPFSMDEWVSLRNTWLRNEYTDWKDLTPEQFFNDGSGFFYEINKDTDKEYRIYLDVGQDIALNGDRLPSKFDNFLRAVGFNVFVQKSGISVKETIATLKSIFFHPEIYQFEAYMDSPDCALRPPPPEPPPPEPKKDCECMCCDNNNNDELLKLILRRIGNLPAQIPNKLTDRKAGRRTVNSLSEFMAQQIRLLDDLMGYFPLEIQIEDSDLTEEGNQTEKLKIDNVAEALTELIGLALALRTESSANLSATLRALVEAGSAKQAATIAHDYAQANADFLGYELKQVEKEVGFTFTPGKTKIEEILQEAEVKIKTVENVDKETFQKAIYPLLEMAARWNAQNWVNLGKGNAGDKLKDIISGSLGIVGDIDRFVNEEKQKENPDEPPKSKFDDFLEEIENGFNTQDGITKPENPYGYPYNERPKIRQLGNTFEEGEDASQV